MQIGNSTAYTKQLQGVSKTEEVDDTETEQTAESEFATYLKGILSPDAANNVSEEELFSSLISERLKEHHGEEMSTEYNTLLSSLKSSYTSASGHVNMEDAAKEALKQLRDSGKLTAEEANKVYSESFSAAQLDTDTTALFDGRGEAGDPTVAVEQMEQALIKAQAMVDKFNAGTETAAARELDEASNVAPVVEVAAPETETAYEYPDTSEDHSDDIFTGSSSDNDNDNSDLDGLALSAQVSGEITTLETNGFLMDALRKMKAKEL